MLKKLLGLLNQWLRSVVGTWVSIDRIFYDCFARFAHWFELNLGKNNFFLARILTGLGVVPAFLLVSVSSNGYVAIVNASLWGLVFSGQFGHIKDVEDTLHTNIRFMNFTLVSDLPGRMFFQLCISVMAFMSIQSHLIHYSLMSAFTVLSFGRYFMACNPLPPGSLKGVFWSRVKSLFAPEQVVESSSSPL